MHMIQLIMLLVGDLILANLSFPEISILFLVKDELGEFMTPDWLGKAATMNDLWHLNRTLIVTYQVEQAD